MIRLYRIPLSTNVERVALALAHKGLKVESVMVDSDDRSVVRRLSGQDLVPVIEDGGKVVYDSMEIVRYLEDRYPEKPLYPRDPARKAEMGRPNPDRDRIARLGKAMTDALDLFEGMLAGREHLMGEFSAADCAAFPFLRYALIHPENDSYLFHKILVDNQPLGNNHPRLAEWIRRVDKRPRV